MRIRNIKPEFWRSDDITALPMDLRLLFIGIWSYVDDNGVGINDARRITADLFALEPDQNGTREWVAQGLRRLSEASLLRLFEADCRSYLHVTSWKKHQRVGNPNPPRYPLPQPADAEPPTSGNVAPTQPLRKRSRPAPKPLRPGTGGQGNRGTEEQRAKRATSAASQPEGDPRFAEFWQAYPRKVERRAAERAWRAAIKRKVDPELMISSAKIYAQKITGTEPRFVKHASSWLNAGAYEDFTQGAVGKPVLTFESLRASQDAMTAAGLIRGAYLEDPQPFDDHDYPAWRVASALRYLDDHEAEIRAALERESR